MSCKKLKFINIYFWNWLISMVQLNGSYFIDLFELFNFIADGNKENNNGPDSNGTARFRKASIRTAWKTFKQILTQLTIKIDYNDSRLFSTIFIPDNSVKNISHYTDPYKRKKMDNVNVFFFSSRPEILQAS